MAQVNMIPDGYHTITPYITVPDAPGLIAFLGDLFGARQTERHDLPDGKVMHAEVRVGDSVLMISDACEQMGPSPANLYVYVQDVDALHRKAMDAGCSSVMAPADMFWGDRFASVKDRWGNTWNIATHIEDVPSHEITARAQAFSEQIAAKAK
jgi:PhnB protein